MYSTVRAEEVSVLVVMSEVVKIDVIYIFIYYLFINIIDVIDNVVCCLFFYCNRYNIAGSNKIPPRGIWLL